MKKNNRLFLLALPTHRFVEGDQFLAADTSLDQFLEAYVVPVKNMQFPYEYLVSFHKLHETALPPCSAFFCKVTQSKPTQRGVQFFEILKDFHKYCNCVDIQPLHEIVQKLIEFCKTD